MSNKFMLMGGAVAVAGIAALAMAGEQRIDKNRAAAVQKFHITQTEFPVMDACEKAMSENNVEYKSGVPNISGCACITREIADTTQPGELGLAAAVVPALISGIKVGEDKAAAAVETAVKQHNLAPQRSTAVFAASIQATAKCSKTDYYLTAEQKTEIADADARRDAKSREAIEYAVKHGHMTREKANERLAMIDRANNR